MDLILVRHGQPERVDVATDHGPADPGLTEQGREEARRAAEWLRHEPVDQVLASPARRARETAEPLAQRLGLEVEIDAGLAEYDHSADHYIPMEQVIAEDKERTRAMLEGRWSEYGGDDPVEFVARVVPAVEALVERSPGSRVVAFCHGGVINVYLAHVIGLAKPLWFYPAYGSIHRVHASREGIRMVGAVNETAHLHLRERAMEPERERAP